MEYDIKYFIDKFTSIPEDRWITGQYIDETGNACCAFGHCGVRETNEKGVLGSTVTPESKALSDIFYKAGLIVACVNDNRHGFYSEPTSKERMLAKLKWFELTNSTKII